MHIPAFQRLQLSLSFTSDNMCQLHLKTTSWTQCGSAVLTQIPHGNSVTQSQYHEHTHSETESQVGNLSCTRGRSHLVCYINNNKRPFHGTSPVLSNHRDLSEVPVNSPVCLPSFSLSFSLSCKSFTHHPPCYLELNLKVMFKVGVHHRDIDLNKLESRRQVRRI